MNYSLSFATFYLTMGIPSVHGFYAAKIICMSSNDDATGALSKIKSTEQ